MGVTWNNGELSVSLIEFDRSDIKKLVKDGYYLEATARLDAGIDFFLDGLVLAKYGNPCCNNLLNAVEKSMRENYTYVSGLVKAQILILDNIGPVRGVKRIKISRDLLNKIRTFKTLRNKMLHSEMGHYNLISSKELKNIRDNKHYQDEAQKRVNEVIELGLKCYGELEDEIMSLED